MMDRTQSINMHVVICDETLLCAVEFDWDAVVVLVLNSSDFLAGGGSQLVVYVNGKFVNNVQCLNKIG